MLDQGLAAEGNGHAAWGFNVVCAAGAAGALDAFFAAGLVVPGADDEPRTNFEEGPVCLLERFPRADMVRPFFREDMSALEARALLRAFAKHKIKYG